LEDIQYKDIYSSLKKDIYFKTDNSLYKPPDRNYHISWIKNHLEIIDKFIDISIDKKHLFNIRNLLLYASNNIFNCYTDGSVKNLGNTDVSLAFGTNIYDKNLNSIAEFYSSIEHNISVIKAELLGIFISLIVMPYKSKFYIYTDCKSNINTFNTLQNQKLKQTSRQYFKIPNNAKIWTSIMDIIDILQLKIEIFKVDAHASDELNNYVDRKVKLIHDQSSDYGLILCNQPLLSINYIPSWNNIKIEQSLRKFLTLITNVTNLEAFLNWKIS
jgi:ribonuclease HI